MKAMTCAVVLYLALLTGCGTLNNRNHPENISTTQVSSGSGIVILSAGAPEKCFSTSTFLKVLPAARSYFDSEVALLSVDGYAVKSDFADHHGYLHAVPLAPGTYYLAAWIANPYVKPVHVPKAEFSVSAGEVIYLGEYYMSVSCVWNPQSQFRDQEKRDMALLAQMNPTLAKAHVVKRISAFSGYAVGGPR